MESVERNHATIKFNPEGQTMHGKRRGPRGSIFPSISII
jgi:hypothetical protein